MKEQLKTLADYLFIIVCVFFIGSCAGTVKYFKGKAYDLNTTPINICYKEKGIKGYSGRIYCMFTTQTRYAMKSRSGRHASPEKVTGYYYLVDNASADDIIKMRNDKSYRPDNFSVYTFYTEDEISNRILSGVCEQWTDYMEGRKDEMPEFYYINGIIEHKGSDFAVNSGMMSAAHGYGIGDEAITNVVIFDKAVNSLYFYIFMICAVLIIVLIIVWGKVKKNNGGY